MLEVVKTTVLLHKDPRQISQEDLARLVTVMVHSASDKAKEAGQRVVGPFEFTLTAQVKEQKDGK